MAKKAKGFTITVYNCSKQMVPVQVRPPNTEFYVNEQQIRIQPGKSVTLAKANVIMEQLVNLQKRGMLRLSNDTELQAERAAAS